MIRGKHGISSTGFTGCGKSAFFVIPFTGNAHGEPSEARDPLFREADQNSRFLGQTPPFGMTGHDFFRFLFSL